MANRRISDEAQAIIARLSGTMPQREIARIAKISQRTVSRYIAEGGLARYRVRETGQLKISRHEKRLVEIAHELGVSVETVEGNFDVLYRVKLAEFYRLSDLLRRMRKCAKQLNQ